MIEKLIAQAAVIVCFARWNPVNREAGVVLTGDISVEASVVLFKITGRRIAQAVLGDIRDVRESTADAGIVVADIGEILLAKAGGKRRTNVQALPGDGSAIYAFSEMGIVGAGCRANDCTENGCSFEIEIGGGNAVRGSKRCKRRGREPSGACHWNGLALSLVVEEGKDLVFPDWPTNAATPLVVTVFIP